MLPDDPVFTNPSEYHSPEPAPGLFARFFPSCAFYPRIWGIIWRGAQVAKAGLYDDEAWALNSLEVVRALESVGCRLHVEGLEHLTAFPGPCIIAGNHMSALETTVLPGLISPRRRVTFVIKSSLTRAFVFRHIMCSRDPVVVGRVNPREDLAAMLEGGKERLQRGMSLVVFPQATRSLQFDRTQFNSIAIKIAGRNNVPVIPLALKTDAWGQGGLHKDYGPVSPHLPVHFRFGAPFRVEGSGKEGQERLCAFIEQARAEWDAELQPALGM